MRHPTIAARPGRSRRLGDLEARARAFPDGAARARLRLVVRMLAVDEIILCWLAQGRLPTDPIPRIVPNLIP